MTAFSIPAFTLTGGVPAIAWQSVPSMGNNWTPASYFNFEGHNYWPENAEMAYDLEISSNCAPSQIVRFEVRPNELWTGAMGGNDTERSEIDGSAGGAYPLGTAFWTGYSFMLEPGAPQISTAGGDPGSPAAWFITGQWHGSGGEAAVPAEMNIITVGTATSSYEHLRFTIQTDPGQTWVTLWDDTNHFVRGEIYDVVVYMRVAGLATDFVQVWVNGSQVVNHTGVIGSASNPSSVYPKFGIYRGWQGDGLPDVAAQYANIAHGTATLAARPANPPPWPIP